jgi:hypothetical protein
MKNENKEVFGNTGRYSYRIETAKTGKNGKVYHHEVGKIHVWYTENNEQRQRLELYMFPDTPFLIKADPSEEPLKDHNE